jgi:dTDP-4-dehydrorhamnose reductase
MTSKILLTGKNGQLGRELLQLLPMLGSVAAFDREELNLASPDAIRKAVREVRPMLIVNAAAYTAVDQAEKEEAAALAINAEAPAILAAEAKKIGAALVHYSTDYIFDGSKRSPYVEDDAPNPINAYGRTKLAGEKAIRDSGAPHLIFRTEWVYARQGRNFLLTILRLAAEREELRIVSDQIGSPTTSREIARATTEILARLLAQDENRLSLPAVSGTYHMTAAGQATWHEFAHAIFEEASSADPSAPWIASATGGRPLIARRINPILTEDYPTPARRPAYSVLSNERLTKTFGVQLPDWRAQLRAVFSAA